VGGSQKNAKRQQKLIIFADESGLSERPPVRSTWAPKGRTPVLVHSHRWAKRSMMGGLIYHWSGRAKQLTVEIIKHAYRLNDILRWCRRLVRVLNGAKAILIWDRLNSHRNKTVLAYLAKHGIEVVLLPAYTPQLNPTEGLWANLKGCELANFCAKDIRDAEHEARRGIKRVRRRLSLMEGFLTGAGLSFGSN
jgi:transposase